MFKRTVAVLLTVVLLLPIVFSMGSFVFMPEINTALFNLDSDYQKILRYALGDINDVPENQETKTLPCGERHLVKFKDNVSEQDIENILIGTEYSLVSENNGKLFEIYGDISAIESSTLIEYSEKEQVRNISAVVNDPAPMTAYTAMGINSAWDTTHGKSNIIVAVLDTGVARNHEDLVNTKILAGYDAVARKSGVNDDQAGHGTGVTGIIAATANNGLGIAGVSSGVTILPIKVSANDTTIYSSDLVRGIRFAADAGAKIINMSIGGYSFSLAEQEAVSYAVSKGCILISAAGNGGSSEYADQMSYPASYEGVISVASCNESGSRSSFSQYNSEVDIAAVGENITMPIINENDESIYRTDSGTSYSCAFVSGIAALIASDIGNARFESNEFSSLLTEFGNNKRDDMLGYGIINAEELLKLSQLPIVTGVSNGESYSHSVKIGFNRGTALLNGENIDDGESIISNGTHNLIITDGDKTKDIKFRLDYTPLSYEFKEFSNYAYFEFERGNATLDGFPYTSKDKITISGRHEFILTDGEEKRTQTISLRYNVPSVYGIENGGKYTSPVEITVVGDGIAMLNGEEFFGETVVAKSGNHTLVLKSGNGAVTQEYKFSIDFPQGKILKTDYANGKAAIDEENGFICLYGESLVGVRIYDINSPEKYLHFLPVGQVYGHAFHGEWLLLFGTNGMTILNRKTALNGQEAVISNFNPDNITLFTYADGNVFCFGGENMYVYDFELESTALVADLGYTCKKVFYSDGYFYIIPNQGSILYIYDMIINQSKALDLGTELSNKLICHGGAYIAVGNRVYSTITGDVLLEFASNHAVKIEGERIYTEKFILDIASGKELAVFPFAVSDIIHTETKNYLLGINPDFAVASRSAEGFDAYCCATHSEKMFSTHEKSTQYRNSLYYNRYYHPLSVATAGNVIYTVNNNRNSIFMLDVVTNGEISAVPLKFKPAKIFCSGGYVAVTFANISMLYIAPQTNVSGGKYIKLPDICTDVAVMGDRAFALVNNTIHVIIIESSRVIEGSVTASEIGVYNNLVYAINGNTLSTYNEILSKQTLETSVSTGGNLLFGNGFAVNRNVYNLESGQSFARTDSMIIAFKGNTIVTENGVFDLKTQEYIGNTGIYSPQFVAISDNNSVVAINNGIIVVNYCAEGDEVTTAPEINGISEYGIYVGSTSISYIHGIGYLDGKAFESGKTISEAGNHTFMLSLPCGRNIMVPFIVEAELGGIEFLGGNKTMSVGEKISLRIVYLPDGAGSVPVNFKSDSDALVVSNSGEIIATATGVYTVTAQTLDGKFTAQCVITVRDDIIAVTPDSGIIIDRNNLIMKNVPAGIKANQLLDVLATGKNAQIIDKNGEIVTGYVGTGCSIQLKDSNNQISDKLSISVIGDTDGDGFISAYDLYQLELILQGYEYSAEFIIAADINQNGVLADNDFRTLRKILLGRNELKSGTPEDSLFASCSMQTISHIKTGDIIDVVVCINGAKDAKGIFGTIAYSQGMEFVECISTGWRVESYDNAGKIGFYAYDPSREIVEKPFKILINLRFKINAQHGEEISLSADKFTVTFEDGCKNVRCQNISSTVEPMVYSDFNINIANAVGFKFDKNRHEYSVKVPHNSAIADIFISYNTDEQIDVSPLSLSNSEDTTITIAYSNNKGAAAVYNIKVERDKAPDIDNNCKLKTLEVEGHKLSPSFNPTYTDYSITVPYGTEKINVYCLPQNNTATVIVSDTTLKGEHTPVTITVGALDGETMVYTINVTMEPKPIEPTIDEMPVSTVPEKEPLPIWAIILISLGGIALVGISVFVFLKNKKRKTE